MSVPTLPQVTKWLRRNLPPESEERVEALAMALDLMDHLVETDPSFKRQQLGSLTAAVQRVKPPGLDAHHVFEQCQKAWKGQE